MQGGAIDERSTEHLFTELGRKSSIDVYSVASPRLLANIHERRGSRAQGVHAITSGVNGDKSAMGRNALFLDSKMEGSVTRFHLAQANIGRFRAPLEDPIMEGFRAQLDPINALADQSPGFVWRLQTEDGNATAIRPYAADTLMAINISVWESLESLQHFVYKGEHVGTLRRRKEWFEQIEGPMLVLWWIPAGHIPSVAEAQARLQYLKEHGPTPHAFTFRTPFPAPDGQPGNVDSLDAAFCAWATPDEPPRG